MSRYPKFLGTAYTTFALIIPLTCFSPGEGKANSPPRTTETITDKDGNVISTRDNDVIFLRGREENYKKTQLG